ncbi:MAG: DUF3426 domain-containing protein [Thermodesulfobacteriota bacterium]
MVVTCEKCHTKFLLDEARFSEAKVQVRCSRCQNVFWVEREEEPPEGAPRKEEETFTPPPAPPPPTAAAEPPGLGEIETEFAPEEMAAAKAALPKPSILFTAHAKRSSRLWIIALVAGLLGGALLGVAIMWFGGYGWVAGHLQPKSPTPAPQIKVKESAKAVAVSPPLTPPAAPGDLKDLELSNQQERYRGLVNSKGGQLLVIQGTVKNASAQPRGPIKIKAMLTDPQQKIVKEREFYAGTVVFDDELQSLDPQEINRWLDTPGGRAQKQILQPGESQSFMVVFFGAPKNLSGYGYKMQVVKGPVVSGKSSLP